MTSTARYRVAAAAAAGALLLGGAALTSGVASAGPKSGATGSLAMGSSLARVASATPSYGSAVDLTAAYSGVRKQDTVRVQLICMQDGSVVYSDARTLTSSPATLNYTLGQTTQTAASVWTEGGASCRSDLFVVGPGGAEINFLATLSFETAAS
jgi:hypothetical protein